jgi:6-pyruvoyl-tetrahydropterin synthase
MFEIFKEFTFEAAHHLAVNVSDGHRYSRLHGHSFQVQVFLKGNVEKRRIGCVISMKSSSMSPNCAPNSTIVT